MVSDTKAGPIQVNLGQQGALDIFDLDDYAGFVRVRYVSDRDLQSARFACHYIVGLTVDGYLLFWNASTSMLLRSLKLLEDGEKAIDFMLLDFTLEKEAKLSENCKVVLLSKATDDTYRVSLGCVHLFPGFALANGGTSK
ncbi:unnamed protein product [Gongylonema pulchrum]|uniref:Uncharacterized protein n=1 Tax=Gongylonema pulchrum TaxID=637853 RepID=A0A3P6QL58_9BILA|nr:unnamed protein product [Gongylonema pulchrum]